jgi:hypothetical protein
LEQESCEEAGHGYADDRGNYNYQRAFGTAAGGKNTKGNTDQGGEEQGEGEQSNAAKQTFLDNLADWQSQEGITSGSGEAHFAI